MEHIANRGSEGDHDVVFVVDIETSLVLNEWMESR